VAVHLFVLDFLVVVEFAHDDHFVVVFDLHFLLVVVVEEVDLLARNFVHLEFCPVEVEDLLLDVVADYLVVEFLVELLVLHLDHALLEHNQARLLVVHEGLHDAFSVLDVVRPDGLLLPVLLHLELGVETLVLQHQLSQVGLRYLDLTHVVRADAQGDAPREELFVHDPVALLVFVRVDFLLDLLEPECEVFEPNDFVLHLLFNLLHFFVKDFDFAVDHEIQLVDDAVEFVDVFVFFEVADGFEFRK